MTPDRTDAVAATRITGAIPRLTDATVSALAEHLRTSEAAVAVAVRALLDADVIAQGPPAATGEATYVTLDTLAPA
ncbi:hypothetical protein [Kineococcus aurantiacus]|uniref:MarR family transcriptional regulator n=1 Tax=Kineococcus aurantiacus TaxID=37633 RepID=A0A7Y9DQ44_9ACTN|nr:hypothetical protein [Kineococcus aurantiacus]NYD24747.1 hypothetical protein [Kineococcus aurantiacus]